MIIYVFVCVYVFKLYLQYMSVQNMIAIVSSYIKRCIQFWVLIISALTHLIGYNYNSWQYRIIPTVCHHVIRR